MCYNGRMKALLGLMGLTLLPLAACSDADSKTLPNVIVVVIDTLRLDELPLYGGDPQNAPFISQLAEEGVVFENAWSTSSWTAPATASIFTSQHPNEHGVTAGIQLKSDIKRRGMKVDLNRIPEELQTLPEFMKSEGYATFAVSDNINVDAAIGFAAGFDHFHYMKGFFQSGAVLLNEKMLSWRDEILGAERFFLYFHYMDPHEPYVRHEEWMDADAPPPSNAMMDRAAYRSEIRNVDEALRRIFAALEIGDDTIVILTADHGQEFMDHGHTGHKWTLYSELTHVPLVLRVGANGPRGRTRANVSHVDILPTLRELLGAPPAAQDRGVSLLAALDEKVRGERKLFAMRTDTFSKEPREMRAIIRGKYKLIVNQDNGRKKLFDLDLDPGETKNLAGANSGLCEELLQLLDEQNERALRVGAAEFTERHLDAQAVRQLETLGYVGGGPDDPEED